MRGRAMGTHRGVAETHRGAGRRRITPRNGGDLTGLRRGSQRGSAGPHRGAAEPETGERREDSPGTGGERRDRTKELQGPAGG